MKGKLLSIVLAFFGLVNFGCPKQVPVPKIEAYATYAVPVNPGEANSGSDRFPNLFDSFKEEECVMVGADGLETTMRKFFLQSKKDGRAIDYAWRKIEELKEYGGKGMSGLELAVKAVDLLRKDLSFVGGTVKYAPDKDKKVFVSKRYSSFHSDLPDIPFVNHYEMDKDSTQTLGTFVSSREGDCDDFARSLVTAYELIKEIARQNKDKEFYSRLYEGLSHYMLIGLDTGYHAMNATVFYNDDFTIAYVRVFEPQIYDYANKKSPVEKDEIMVRESKFYVLRTYKSKDGKEDTEKARIKTIYSSEVCYEQY